MGIPFSSIDAVLNLGWALLSLATLLLSWRSRRTREHKRALVAILFLVVLLFPVISTADELAEQAMVYDPSPITLKSAHGFKQVMAPALPATHAGHGLAHPLQDAVGEALESESARSGIFSLLSSASGIHSPPQL